MTVTSIDMNYLDKLEKGKKEGRKKGGRGMLLSFPWHVGLFMREKLDGCLFLSFFDLFFCGRLLALPFVLFSGKERFMAVVKW